MIRLGIDLSLPEGSVSLEVNGRVAASTIWNKPRLHAEVVFLQIERVLNLSGVDRRDIEEVVVSSGPGSFTGVRLSVAVGKALKECGIRVLCATTLEALKYGYHELGFTPIPVIPARRGKVYAELEGRNVDIPPEDLLVKIQKLRNPLLIHKGELPPVLSEIQNLEEMAPLSVKLLQLPHEKLSPLTFHYVRDHDAKPQSGIL